LQQVFLPPQKETGDDVIPSGVEDTDSKQEPELNKQLRILITRLSTSILIFAVIRQSLDHARHKALNSKSDQSVIGEELPSIDSKTQNYCFILTLLFFVDFISAWFDQYSKYFAGNRFEKVSNILERVIQQFYEFKLVFILVGVFSELYLIGQYMK